MLYTEPVSTYKDSITRHSTRNQIGLHGKSAE